MLPSYPTLQSLFKYGIKRGGKNVIKNYFLHPLEVTDSKAGRKLRHYVYFIQSLQIWGSNTVCSVIR